MAPATDDHVDPASGSRDVAAGRIAMLAPEIGRTCRSMAERFEAGAVLHALGTGVSAVDAAHVTVEFIHPVIVGKRSLPALRLDPEHIALAAAGSIVLALRLGPDASVDDALVAAKRQGCLTIELCGGEHGHAVEVDHRLCVEVDDRAVGRELQVTAYHLIWELVHEFLDGASAKVGEGPAELSGLYPFLYERGDEGMPQIIQHVVDSTTAKGAEIGALRSRVLGDAHRSLREAATSLRTAADAGRMVWTFGNGGSSTDAQAFAWLLSVDGGDGTNLRARSLTDDVATLTALANDVSFDVVFARTLRSLARPGDVAVGFSTSGGSRNVLDALAAAVSSGVTTIGFAGYDGGDMARASLDHLFVVPSASVHRIQEAQTTLAHALVALARGVDR